MAVSKALKVAAQAIMDAYYQDFKPDDAFFDIEDFAKWVGMAYGKMADDVAKEIYLSSRSEGVPMLVFSQDWWVKKTVGVKNNIADISEIKFAGFTYDSQNSGIQQISDGVRFVRTTLTELWQLQRVSKSNIIYWYVDYPELKLRASCQLPEKIDVYYIPSSFDSEFKIPKSKEFEIAAMAWNFMITAKKETPFVDTTNNSNKNVAPGTEIDLSQTKAAQTKEKDK